MDPYDILGVDRGCDNDTAKAAYRKLVMQYHPDKGGDPVRFQRVKDAYESIVSTGVSDVFKKYSKRWGDVSDFGVNNRFGAYSYVSGVDLVDLMTGSASDVNNIGNIAFDIRSKSYPKQRVEDGVLSFIVKDKSGGSHIKITSVNPDGVTVEPGGAIRHRVSISLDEILSDKINLISMTGDAYVVKTSNFSTISDINVVIPGRGYMCRGTLGDYIFRVVVPFPGR